MGYRYSAKSGEKWGYLNNDGKWVIPPQYDQARHFSNDRAWVSVNGREYMIDPSGNIAIELQENPIILDFHEGKAWCNLNGRIGYINPEGKWIIAPGSLTDI